MKAARPGSNGSETDTSAPQAAGDRLEGVALERIEVVEAIDEQRRGAPALGSKAQRVERPPGEQLGVGEPGGVQPGAVAAVDGGHLLGVLAPRSVAGPVAQRAGEAGGLDHGAPELGHEARGGTHEAGLRGRLGEQVEPGAPHRILDDQLSLHVGGHAPRVAGSSGDLAEEPVEAQYARAEDGSALGELALGVLDVSEGGHHQDRLVVEAGAQPAEHLAGLRGVGGSGYEGEGHFMMVAARPDCLTRARPCRPPTRAPG